MLNKKLQGRPVLKENPEDIKRILDPKRRGSSIIERLDHNREAGLWRTFGMQNIMN